MRTLDVVLFLSILIIVCFWLLDTSLEVDPKLDAKTLTSTFLGGLLSLMAALAVYLYQKSQSDRLSVQQASRAVQYSLSVYIVYIRKSLDHLRESEIKSRSQKDNLHMIFFVNPAFLIFSSTRISRDHLATLAPHLTKREMSILLCVPQMEKTIAKRANSILRIQEKLFDEYTIYPSSPLSPIRETIGQLNEFQKAKICRCDPEIEEFMRVIEETLRDLETAHTTIGRINMRNV